MDKKTNLKLYGLFAGGLLLMNFPLIGLFAGPQRFAGIPLSLFYLFGLWLAIILLSARLLRHKS